MHLRPKRQQKGSKSNPSLFDMFQISNYTVYIRLYNRCWQVPNIAWECALMYFSSFSIKSSLSTRFCCMRTLGLVRWTEAPRRLQTSGKHCCGKVVKIFPFDLGPASSVIIRWDKRRHKEVSAQGLAQQTVNHNVRLTMTGRRSYHIAAADCDCEMGSVEIWAHCKTVSLIQLIHEKSSVFIHGALRISSERPTNAQ